MVLNTTFNNISVISWHSILLVEETGCLYFCVLEVPINNQLFILK
jgi:hypothetical protein